MCVNQTVAPLLLRRCVHTLNKLKGRHTGVPVQQLVYSTVTSGRCRGERCDGLFPGPRWPLWSALCVSLILLLFDGVWNKTRCLFCLWRPLLKGKCWLRSAYVYFFKAAQWSKPLPFDGFSMRNSLPICSLIVTAFIRLIWKRISSFSFSFQWATERSICPCFRLH